jgi:hypothetical protein
MSGIFRARALYDFIVEQFFHLLPDRTARQIKWFREFFVIYLGALQD